MKKSPLSKIGKSPVSQAKQRVQALLRLLAIKRAGGCILRHYSEAGLCGGHRKDGELILQFDHLSTREKNISWHVDLGVIVCIRHHLYFKRQYPAEYERMAIDNIGEERAKFLYRVRADHKPHPMSLWDWNKLEIYLSSELKKLSEKNGR